RLKDWIDPLMDVSGLWQGDWELFAPDVIKRSARMSAEIRCTNGVTIVWQSPLLHTLPIAQRFLRFRDGEFFDTIRNDNQSGGWDAHRRFLGGRGGGRGGRGGGAVPRRQVASLGGLPAAGAPPPPAAGGALGDLRQALPAVSLAGSTRRGWNDFFYAPMPTKTC